MQSRSVGGTCYMEAICLVHWISLSNFKELGLMILCPPWREKRKEREGWPCQVCRKRIDFCNQPPLTSIAAFEMNVLNQKHYHWKTLGARTGLGTSQNMIKKHFISTLQIGRHCMCTVHVYSDTQRNAMLFFAYIYAVWQLTNREEFP